MKVPGGSQGLHGWTLEFDAPSTSPNIWGAEIVSHVGNHYVIRNVAWNADVPAGGKASFGFQAKPGAGGTTATGFTLNGTADTPRRRRRRVVPTSRSTTPRSPKATAAPASSPSPSSSRRPPRCRSRSTTPPPTARRPPAPTTPQQTGTHHLRRRRDHQDDHRPGHRRHRGRGQRDLHRTLSGAVGRHHRRRLGDRHHRQQRRGTAAAAADRRHCRSTMTSPATGARASPAP